MLTGHQELFGHKKTGPLKYSVEKKEVGLGLVSTWTGDQLGRPGIKNKGL